MNNEEKRQLAEKKANEEKIANQKRKLTLELLRAEKNIKELENYLQEDIDSPLALTIIDHVENLKKRINQNNYENLVLINTKVDKFIYKEYILPSEIKAAEKRKIEEEKKKIEEEKRKRLAKAEAERRRKQYEKKLAERKRENKYILDKISRAASCYLRKPDPNLSDIYYEMLSMTRKGQLYIAEGRANQLITFLGCQT